MGTPVDEYLKTLPIGVNSYPKALCRYSVVSSFSIGLESSPWIDALPETVRDIIGTSPSDSLLIPEVYAQCAFLAQAMTFETMDDYLFHCTSRTRALLSGPLYLTMFKMFSGRRAAHIISRAYKHFHKGSECRSSDTEPNMSMWKSRSPKTRSARHLRTSFRAVW